VPPCLDCLWMIPPYYRWSLAWPERQAIHREGPGSEGSSRCLPIARPAGRLLSTSSQ